MFHVNIIFLGYVFHNTILRTRILSFGSFVNVLHTNSGVVVFVCVH